MKKYIALLITLLLAGNAAAQTTSRFFADDYKYTPSEFTINANTANGSDNSRFNLSAGGGTDIAAVTTRGAHISLDGADYGGAGAGGDVEIVTADNGDIKLNAYGAAGYIDFWANNDQRWFIPPSAGNKSEFIFDIDPIDAQWSAYIMAYDHSDGHDTGRLSLTGGGAIGATRGGRIDLYGADRGGAGLGGDVNIVAADNGDIDLTVDGSGDIVLNTGATGFIDFSTNGDQKWFISPEAAGTSYLLFGSVGAVTNATIADATLDAADKGTLTLSGGGTPIGTTRGGYIILEGADFGGAGAGGDINITGAVNGDIDLTVSGSGDVVVQSGATGFIDFETNSKQRWFIPPSAGNKSEFIFDAQPIDTDWNAYIMAYDHGDSHDYGALTLSGGGAVGIARGGRITIQGADFGAVSDRGDINIIAATDGDIDINTDGSGDVVISTGATGYIDFVTNAEQKWFMPPSAAANAEIYFGDNVAVGGWLGQILAATLDGNDESRLTLSGGGAASSTRGARIDLMGADRAGVEGDLNLISADNGDITISSNSGGNVIIDDSAGTTWSAFGSVATGTACTTVNGDYVTIKLNNIDRRIMLCD